MTLDEYILAFRALGHRCELSPKMRAQARHLYICLALDMPSAIEARRRLLAEAQHDQLRACGPNVPSLFEAKLTEKLQSHILRTETPERQMGELIHLLITLSNDLIEAGNPGYKVRDPFCRCDCNQRNRSYGWNGKPFFRYISLDVFEKHILFPGKAGSVPVTVENRRFFYSQDRVQRLTREPRLFGLERDNRVLLGKPPKKTEEKAFQTVIFLVPSDSAPHEENEDAVHIASKLGLSDYLNWETADERRNQGFAVLRFYPDDHDLLYRPSVVDALEHLAFRPGPTDDGLGEFFRHGWTRVFKLGELVGEEAIIADELGCKEVIMPSRWERFPSEALILERVCFFES